MTAIARQTRCHMCAITFVLALRYKTRYNNLLVRMVIINIRRFYGISMIVPVVHQL
jgi:hypothetical protein